MPRPEITAPRTPQEKLRVLIPEATRNYIKNPSFKYNTTGWEPAWVQEATFEKGKINPYSDLGVDAVTGTVTIEGGADAIRGDYSARMDFDGVDLSNRYLEFTEPNNESKATIEYYMDLTNIAAGAGVNFRHLRTPSSGAGAVSFDVIIATVGAFYRITPGITDDAGAQTFGGSYTLAAGLYLFRLECKCADAPGSNNGYYRLYINGNFVSEITGVDNDTHDIDGIRLGAVSSLDAGFTGYALFDNFRWSRSLLQPFTGASVETSTERARFGTTSLKIQTDGNDTNEGPYFRVDPSTQNTFYAGSIYARGEGVWRVRVKDGFNGDEAVSDPITLNDDRWTHIEDVIGKTGFEVSNDLRLYFETDDDVPQAVTAYIDGAQLEQKLYSTTYCDGSITGCRWNIQAHNSESTRSAETRAGGRWYPLTDEEIYVTVWSGGGTPPLRNNTQDFGQAPGAFFQSVKYLSRVMNLTFHVIDPNGDELCAGDSARLAALRRTLWDFIKPDRVKDQQPFWLEYTEGTTSLYLEVRYEAGMELETDIRNRWFNNFALRLLSVSPFWEEDGQEVVQLDYQDNFTVAFLAAKVDGVWQNLDTEGMEVRATLVEDQQGRVWTTARANLAGAGDVFLYYFDGETWHKIPEAINSLVNHLTVDANGNIWLGGAFTDIGGTTISYVGYYNPTADTWNALDLGGGNEGVNDVVTHVEIAPNGDVYVGGNFTQDGAGTAFNYIARWDGVQFNPIGPAGVNGFNSYVSSIAITKDGRYIYMGGNFTSSDVGGANEIPYIAVYDTNDDSLGPVGAGFNAAPLEIKLDKAGSLYATGGFSDIYGVVFADGELDRIAKWNGSAWLALGSGFDGNGFTFAIDSKGNLYAVGIFTDAGGINIADGFAVWNGTSWAHTDLNVNDVPNFGLGRAYNAIMVTSQDDLFLTWSSGGAVVTRQAQSSATTTVENIGSQEVPPIFWIKGPGHLKWIENQTSDDILYLDYVLLEGEELTIDCAAGKITSTFRGEDYTGLLPQSDFGAFQLLPGDNTIAVFMDDDVDAEVQIRYTPRHATVDAVSANIWDE